MGAVCLRPWKQEAEPPGLSPSHRPPAVLFVGFNNSFIEHKIHPFKVYNSVIFSVFTALHNTAFNTALNTELSPLSLEYFHHPKKKPYTH